MVLAMFLRQLPFLVCTLHCPDSPAGGPALTERRGPYIRLPWQHVNSWL